jgi:phosphohistidine phosphatase SixA
MSYANKHETRKLSGNRLTRRRHPKSDCRRALELLAASSNGVTETLLIAHGVTVAQMVELVRAGLASAPP